MKRLVFLDFDGVIMTETSYTRPRPPRDPDSPTHARDHAVSRMDAALVANVQTLCERADAEVVLSTTWRQFGTLIDGPYDV